MNQQTLLPFTLRGEPVLSCVFSLFLLVLISLLTACAQRMVDEAATCPQALVVQGGCTATHAFTDVFEQSLEQVDDWLGLQFDVDRTGILPDTEQVLARGLTLQEHASEAADAWLIPAYRSLGLRRHSDVRFYRRQYLWRLGVTAASARAERLALAYFAASQLPSGYWSQAEPVQEHDKAAGSAAGRAALSTRDDAVVSADISLLFLRAGYDHRTPNVYRENMRAAIIWQVQQLEEALAQAAPGPLSSEDLEYLSRIGMPVLEAYALTNDSALEPMLRSLIEVLLREQLWWQGGWLGWGQWQAGEGAETIALVDMGLSLHIGLFLHIAQSVGLATRQQGPPPGLEDAAFWQSDALEAFRHSAHAAYQQGLLPGHWSPQRQIEAAPAHPSIALRLAALFAATDWPTQQWAKQLLASDLFEQGAPDLQHLQWASQGIFIIAHEHWQKHFQALQQHWLPQQMGEEDHAQYGAWVLDNRWNSTVLSDTAAMVALLQIPQSQAAPLVTKP